MGAKTRRGGLTRVEYEGAVLEDIKTGRMTGTYLAFRIDGPRDITVRELGSVWNMPADVSPAAKRDDRPMPGGTAENEHIVEVSKTAHGKYTTKYGYRVPDAPTKKKIISVLRKMSAETGVKIQTQPDEPSRV